MTDIPAPRRRHWIRWTVTAIVGLLLIAVGWIVVRGLNAVSDLQSIKESASHMRADVAAGDVRQATRAAQGLTAHAASARDLTGDPVWRAFEIVPLLGPNLTATRELAEISDDIATGAVQPVLRASSALDLSRLGLHDGTIDLEPFRKVQRPLADAATALSRTSAQAHRIDTDTTLRLLADAVSELRAAIDEAESVIDTLHDTALLIPTMLGGDGPRTYVIAMLNNAELRSDGGIIGALAAVRADNGSLSIVGNASTADFGRLVDPLPMSAAAVALFGDSPGRYIQNITSIPDFTEAAPLLASRWQSRFGGSVDGVMAIDTVVAQHLLRATGPQKVGPFTIDADNVLRTLLSKVYRVVPDPIAQDAVFAEVAAELFTAAMHVDKPQALLSAMADASNENRIRIWSAHTDEQRVLAASTLGGALPHDSAAQSHVGVLVNDLTGGKMDFYTRMAFGVSTGLCHGDPTTRVTVTWTNTAPADSAGSLPAYVTGGGHFGIAPGSIRTLIAVYGPEGATPARIERDGTEQQVQTADLDGRIAVQHDVLLTPGGSTTITVDYIGKGAGVTGTAVVHTPLAFGPKITSDTLSCRS